MSYKLGLVSVSFRKNSPEEIIREMKTAGLSRIEWGSDVHAPKDDTRRLNQIVGLQKQYGVACCSYGTYFRLGSTPIDELESYIHAAKLLGTDILRLWCGDKNAEEYTDAQRKALFDQCRLAAAVADQHKVKLCMECHNQTYTNTKDAALQLLHAVASPCFRMYWQPNQYRSEQENLEYASAVSEYTERIHVFYWTGDKRLALKDGIGIWKEYLRRFSSDQTLLLEFMPDDRLHSLPAEAEALRRITEE